MTQPLVRSHHRHRPLTATGWVAILLVVSSCGVAAPPGEELAATSNPSAPAAATSSDGPTGGNPPTALTADRTAAPATRELAATPPPPSAATPATTAPTTPPDPGMSLPEPANPPGTSLPGPVDPPGPPPSPGPFAMNLYVEGDAVAQAKKIWCVPAAMLTMINIIGDGPPDTKRRTQAKLYALARELSGQKLTDLGAEPEGWAAGLTQLGYGSYVVTVEETRRGAIQAAARALRATGRPVGLLTWRGAHSWVMSGFTATADPALTDAFTVSAVSIQDVWYPRVSSIWGPSDPPNTLVPFERLRIDYLPWDRPNVRHPDKDGRFVLVLPVEDA